MVLYHFSINVQIFGEGKEYTDEEFLQKTGMRDPLLPKMKDITINEKGVLKLLLKKFESS